MGEASKVKGVCSEDFKSVRELFEAHFEEDVSTGAALAVYLHGKPVIDLYGGHKDEAKTQLWEANTLVNVYSVTKAWTGTENTKNVSETLKEYISYAGALILKYKTL